MGHGGIEAAHTPHRARRIVSIGKTIEDALLDSGSIWVQIGARGTALGQLDDGGADFEALADAPGRWIESAGRQVLAEGAVEDAKSFGTELVNGFSGNDQDGLVRSAVALLVALVITR